MRIGGVMAPPFGVTDVRRRHGGEYSVTRCVSVPDGVSVKRLNSAPLSAASIALMQVGESLGPGRVSAPRVTRRGCVSVENRHLTGRRYVVLSRCRPNDGG